MSTLMSLLRIRDLGVEFETMDGTVNAVNGVSFDLQQGETMAIVGESGSGKSQTAFSIMGLLAQNGRANGSVQFDGQEILNMPEQRLNRIRADKVSMIFQDPMTSLNPYMRVSRQMMEVLTHHKGMNKRTLWKSPSACWTRCASPKRATAFTCTRTNSPAACVSG